MNVGCYTMMKDVRVYIGNVSYECDNACGRDAVLRHDEMWVFCGRCGENAEWIAKTHPLITHLPEDTGAECMGCGAAFATCTYLNWNLCDECIVEKHWRDVARECHERSEK